MTVERRYLKGQARHCRTAVPCRYPGVIVERQSPAVTRANWLTRLCKVIVLCRLPEPINWNIFLVPIGPG